MSQKIFDILPPEPPTILDKEKLRPFQEKTSLFRRIREKMVGGKKGLILLLFILIFLGAFCYFKLPRAKIEVWPEREILNFEERLIADSKVYQINIPEKILPARIFEIDEQGVEDFLASGKLLNEAKAEGTIRVFNDYHRSQTLISNTRFQPPGEEILYFRTQKKIIIPAKSHFDVEVIADRSGAQFNIAPSTFSIPGLVGLPQYTLIYGRSFKPMGGGFKGKVPIVLEEDIENAKNILTEKLFIEAKDSIKNKISEDFILSDGVFKEEILETASSVEPGKETQSFNFSAKIKLKALLFKKADLQDLVEEFIISQIPEDKKISQETLKIDFLIESVDFKLGKIFLNLKSQALIFSDIDELALIEALKGKSIEEVNILSGDLPEIVEIKVDLFPFWVNRVPEKVEIKLNLDASTGA